MLGFKPQGLGPSAAMCFVWRFRASRHGLVQGFLGAINEASREGFGHICVYKYGHVARQVCVGRQTGRQIDRRIDRYIEDSSCIGMRIHRPIVFQTQRERSPSQSKSTAFGISVFRLSA